MGSRPGIKVAKHQSSHKNIPEKPQPYQVALYMRSIKHSLCGIPKEEGT